MPDRMIREGFKHSPRVNQLDDRAECAFIRLLTTVDDYGVYYAEPLMVRAAIWPTKSYRVSDVVRVLDSLERAGLIARYTAKDGVRYLCLLRFRQKLAYGLRRKHPAPPFDEDEGDQRTLELEAIADPPPQTNTKKRREEKGRQRAEAAPPPSPPPIILSQDAWLTELRARFPHFDLSAELIKASASRKKLGKELERGWFEAQWLPKCTPRVTMADVKAPIAEGPSGWREWIGAEYPIADFPDRTVYEEGKWEHVPRELREKFLKSCQA